MSHGESETSGQPKPQLVDWDCALSTNKHPKSCLYSFDAEPGSKVVGPILEESENGDTSNNNNQWITLTSLVRLRRTDPTKVEPLWHMKYSILNNWMNPNSSYSLYTHLNPIGTMLSYMLDTPTVLVSAIIITAMLTILLTFPIWEWLVQTMLKSQVMWMQWPNWARFVHAAFPLKLLLGQMAWKALAIGFTRVYNSIRNSLIEYECQLYQNCIPLTIIENNENNKKKGRVGNGITEEIEVDIDDVAGADATDGTWYDAVEEEEDDSDDDDDDY